MLQHWNSHESYQFNLRLKLITHFFTQKSRVNKLDKSISKLYLLNLDSLLSVIKPLYSDFGRPAKNQQGIIRSLVLMLDRHNYSITNWAGEVACDPLLFDICGFEDTAPSVASYYDFLVRLWQSSQKLHISRKLKCKRFTAKPKKKLKQNKKLPSRKPGSVKRLVKKALDGKLKNFCPERILQKFLKHCVVDTSAKIGILGDVNSFSFAGDGSPYYSGASHYGVKTCDCRSKGIFNCTCPRRFSDPDAKWGWDSYREQWFFGSTLYCVTASDSPYDLPIYLKSVQASRHDSVSTIFALEDIQTLYPSFKFEKFLADGAMDKYPIYEYLYHNEIIPFIPLDSRTQKKLLYPDPAIQCFDNKGRPICLGGIPYVDWGYCKPKGIKLRCWFATQGIEPPVECKCSQSPYGRVVYLKPDYDLRLFPLVHRNSDEFKKTFKRRSTVERSFKRMFEDYCIESYSSQGNRLRFSLATFAAINVHLDAWIKHEKFSLFKILDQVA
jgi:hypothetical protein